MTNLKEISCFRPICISWGNYKELTGLAFFAGGASLGSGRFLRRLPSDASISPYAARAAEKIAKKSCKNKQITQALTNINVKSKKRMIKVSENHNVTAQALQKLR